MSEPLTTAFGVARGDHAWIRYAGEDERRELRAAQVLTAAERGERVVFVHAGARRGRPGDAPVEGGQATVIAPRDAGFAAGRLDARRLMDVLEQQIAHAARLGLRGLRLCVELADVLQETPDVAEHGRARGEGNGPTGGCPLAALPALPRPPAIICHGDRARLPGPRLRALERRHALVLEAEPALTRGPQLCVLPVHGPAGLRLVGELDGSNIGVLARALETAPLDGRDLHLDVRELRHADVAAVRLLVRVAAAMPDGHRLVLHAPGPVVSAVLRHFGWAGRLVLEEGGWG
ncbi:STAS domain-containing protein [Actinomadura spongiicola]|uniref:STAS domain-containing protein n=1 Tax=Actinomadura spongiicola TaxID=2303421 RepID=A0A372GAV3_9ACTN|nr:STAS domain-containing protein [Actinomadura spongiicola]RFS82528.1 STAS domain-containing protein [Actinomadura spongiicola]